MCDLDAYFMMVIYTIFSYTAEKVICSQVWATSLHSALIKWIDCDDFINDWRLSQYEKTELSHRVCLHYEYIKPVPLNSLVNCWYCPISDKLNLYVVTTSRVVSSYNQRKCT